jgi:1-phosphatidylinositol phosphodiesterase
MPVQSAAMLRPTTVLVLAGVLGACSAGDASSDWMAGLEDERLLSELSIPGTHDSGALFEPIAGLSKNQDLEIAAQLAAGIRYLDIRCRNVEDRFYIFHGSVDQHQGFDQVLATIYAFLDAHPGETVIASVMQETEPQRATRNFEAVFADYTGEAPGRWNLSAAIPTLGEARGKIVLLRRFDATASPLGIDATAWPDNSRVIFSIDNTAMLRVQDAYRVASNDEKWGSITDMLAETRTGSPSSLYLNYTSGYQTIDGLANIPIVSSDINARLDALLAQPANLHARLGVLVMDHIVPGRVQAIFTTNL